MRDEREQGIARSLWPFGLALAIAATLVGLVISWWLVAIGGGVTLVIGGLWIVDTMVKAAKAKHPHLLEETEEPLVDDAAPARRPAPALGPMTRSRFLEAGTLALGGVMGGAITVPAVGFVIAPAFQKQPHVDANVGPLTNFPEGTFMVTTFLRNPKEGDVSRRTAYVRYNGLLGDLPSFSVISNRCAHLGCPVQPSGPIFEETAKKFTTTTGEVTLIESKPAGFACPCHGGAYDSEGNRTAGPPVRGLDRYEFLIRDGNLYIGKMYSVGHVKGTGANAVIQKFDLASPGQHVADWEWWLYPAQPPH